jgi:hypothetical protein
VTACAKDPQVFDSQVELMSAIGLSLFLLVRDLYSDLLVRKRIDKRWEHARCLYRRKMIFAEDEYELLTRTFNE